MDSGLRETIHMTFQLPGGVSSKGEKALWRRGILTWNDFFSHGGNLLSPSRVQSLSDAIASVAHLLEIGDLHQLVQHFPMCALRLCPVLLSEACFFDIETTGLDPEDPPVTASVYAKGALYLFVAGRNLDQLPQLLKVQKFLVSFYGRRFDVPRLTRHLGLRVTCPHLDLGPIVRRLGFGPGLKRALQQLGMQWPPGLPDAGGDAPPLWYEYCKGRLHALRTLLTYNAYDTVSLAWLWTAVYNASLKDWPLFRPIPPPQFPRICETVERFLALTIGDR
jgi:uncharacterized protein YprB with RNaseH-like and TPR domain